MLPYKKTMILQDSRGITMINIVRNGVFIKDGLNILEGDASFDKTILAKNTISYGILDSHNKSGSNDSLKIVFDAMASHDITYVGIIQTAKASGMTKFPLPYVLTNCHNSLCAVGGTINEDDHKYGLSAAKKYGGIYVPAHHAVIHQYMREEMTACGKMILGSDSHTRYGALGTMAIGEGGPELVKQLMEKTYDIKYPEIIAVYLEGCPPHGVGPHDIALSIIGKVFKEGFVKNKILEFVGPGIENLSVDYRNGIDVMTTETTCLSSIWCTDNHVEDYYKRFGRGDDYSCLVPKGIAYYDGMVTVNLSKSEPMIALPFHPSNVYTIAELKKNPLEIFRNIEDKFTKDNPHLDMSLGLTDKIIDGNIVVDQGIIAGCSGGLYEFIYKATEIIKTNIEQTNQFDLSIYPASEVIHYELLKNNIPTKLIEAGVVLKTAFCGPCFGAGDVPSHKGLSIRHTTRNFPNREGSKPSDDQIASVALMDALSIAATAINGGVLTSATELADYPSIDYKDIPRMGETSINKFKVYNGYNNPEPKTDLIYGPNIKNWPEMIPLTNDILIQVVTVINDDVTTTDELIPSGETSSLRSNPLKLAEFTLSRKDPNYVAKSKKMDVLEQNRRLYLSGSEPLSDDNKNLFELLEVMDEQINDYKKDLPNVSIGSMIYAKKPGDGSAREQAASCQRVLGGVGNIAIDYATKRYRSNLINWGMLPFTVDETIEFMEGDYLYVKGIRNAISSHADSILASIIRNNKAIDIVLKIEDLSEGERDIILDGCLINYYKNRM